MGGTSDLAEGRLGAALQRSGMAGRRRAARVRKTANLPEVGTMAKRAIWPGASETSSAARVKADE